MSESGNARRTIRADQPVVDAESRPYWEAARAGRLLLRVCRDCDRPHHYPRPFCPFCWSEKVDWAEACGRATLYAYSVVHRNDLPPFAEQVPYVAAVVELAEGPRMMTNVVDCPPDQLAVDMIVQVAFREQGDVVVPVFRPV